MNRCSKSGDVKRCPIDESDIDDVVAASILCVLENHLVWSSADQERYPVGGSVRHFGYIDEHAPEARIVLYLPSDSGSVKGCQGRQPHSSIGLRYPMSGIDSVACLGGEARLATRNFESCAPCCEVIFQHAFGVCRNHASREGQVGERHQAPRRIRSAAVVFVKSARLVGTGPKWTVVAGVGHMASASRRSRQRNRAS